MSKKQIYPSNRITRLQAGIEKNSEYRNALIAADKFMRILFYVAYAVLLVASGVRNALDLIPLSIVPLIGFVLVTLMRSKINASRPYEEPGAAPLIPRSKKGGSFPSRHAFSSFAIAFSWFAYSEIIACMLVFCAAATAVIRVIGGVHYPRDVVAGAALGIFCGCAASAICFYL